MTCVHLQQLYKHCERLDVKLGSSDLIRVVCRQCGKQEVRPSTPTIENDLKQPQLVVDAARCLN